MSADRTESTFRLEYTVRTEIAASPETVWARLTNAEQFPSWNSTVTNIEDEIASGKRLKIRVPIAPERTFGATVSEFEPNRRMVWSDGMAPMFRGVRTYELEPGGQGKTTFVMTEVFSGMMLPMIKGSLPDFRPVFAQYAEDLRAACERA